MRLLSSWLLASALLIGTVSARADDVDPGPARPRSTPTEPAEKAESHAKPHIGKPVFLGLLAALFLIIGAAAGANDKASKKRQV